MNSDLTPPDEPRNGELIANPEDLAALCLAKGLSQRATAKASGLSVSTVRRRASDPDFQRRVTELRRELLQQAVGVLIGATKEAATTLKSICRKGSNEFVRIMAARSILQLGGLTEKLLNEERLVQRIEDLEKVLAPRKRR